ncbi:MAG: phosphoribosylformylglycinamidine synthase, purS protein, partial [Acidobacteria bacterium]
MQVEVRVKLKEQVLDPQGEAIRRVLAGLGYAEVGQVRVGKLMLLDVADGDPNAVRARVEEACREVLAN